MLKDGSLGIPEGPINVAWYMDGVIPGEIGNAVMDGHFGWKDGIPAVFDKLNQLNKGDKIIVQNIDGTVLNFTVTGYKVFDKDDNSQEVFVSNDKKSHLNLITCKGIWNKSLESYSERLVIFSDLEI